MKLSHIRIPQGILIRFSGELDHHEAGKCIEYLEKNHDTLFDRPHFSGFFHTDIYG